VIRDGSMHVKVGPTLTISNFKWGTRKIGGQQGDSIWVSEILPTIMIRKAKVLSMKAS
jgi:hypothetical protein